MVQKDKMENQPKFKKIHHASKVFKGEMICLNFHQNNVVGLEIGNGSVDEGRLARKDGC